MNTMNTLKQSVYRANMALFHSRLVVETWGNVSGIDRASGIVAIKPSGVPYDALTADQIVLVNLETGRPLDGSLRPSSDLPTHLELYRAFPEIGGVTHTHSSAATAWAQACRPIPCLGTTHADHFRGEIPTARFLTEQETAEAYEANTGIAIIETFAGRCPLHTPGVLVCGHGPFTWGRDAQDSVHNAVILEEVAKIALMTLQLAPACPPLPGHVADKHFNRKFGPDAYYGQIDAKHPTAAQ